MKILALCLTFITGLIFLGCSHSSGLTKKYLPENEAGINYSVIYYIHADSDYLYHDSSGLPVRDNLKVLMSALEVAEAAYSGEIFIYYQRSESKLLGLFPRKRSRFFHYRNGHLFNKIKYRHRNKEEAFLTTEAKLMNLNLTQNRTHNHQNYFLYFGHEIPSKDGEGYHRSMPDSDVNTDSFAKGIQRFLLTSEDKFDLLVLSTCNNGTPAMAERMMPFTDVMLASPQNLHLSHVESGDISLLEDEPKISPLQLGHSMAEKTFQHLADTVHTTITLAIYNFEVVRDYIHTLTSLTSANTFSGRFTQVQENVDCSELPNFDSESYQNGVETWYKPARFGFQNGLSTHSGWGCKPPMENLNH